MPFLLERLLAPLLRAILTLCARYGLGPPDRLRWLMTHLRHRVVVCARLFTGDAINVVANDQVGMAILKWGVYESDCIDVVGRLVCAGDVVLDVGAHVGQYSLLMARRVGASGAVHAFEPDPDTFDLLQLNIDGRTNIFARQVALGTKQGRLRLYRARTNNIGANSLRPQNPHSAQDELDVAVIALDDYVASIGRPAISFVKMDVEGAELEALRGASQLLQSETKPIVLLEFNQERLRAFGISATDVSDFLEQFGYALFLVRGDCLVRVGDEVLRPYENVLAVPPHRVTDLRKVSECSLGSAKALQASYGRK